MDYETGRKGKRLSKRICRLCLQVFIRGGEKNPVVSKMAEKHCKEIYKYVQNKHFIDVNEFTHLYFQRIKEEREEEGRVRRERSFKTKSCSVLGFDGATQGNISERTPCLHVTQILKLGNGQCLLSDVFSFFLPPSFPIPSPLE